LNRGQIRASAERLYKQGFWYLDDLQMHMTISAGDLG